MEEVVCNVGNRERIWTVSSSKVRASNGQFIMRFSPFILVGHLEGSLSHNNPIGHEPLLVNKE